MDSGEDFKVNSWVFLALERTQERQEGSGFERVFFLLVFWVGFLVLFSSSSLYVCRYV